MLVELLLEIVMEIVTAILVGPTADEELCAIAGLRTTLCCWLWPKPSRALLAPTVKEGFCGIAR